jgi:hypothetical protein
VVYINITEVRTSSQKKSYYMTPKRKNDRASPDSVKKHRADDGIVAELDEALLGHLSSPVVILVNGYLDSGWAEIDPLASLKRDGMYWQIDAQFTVAIVPAKGQKNEISLLGDSTLQSLQHDHKTWALLKQGSVADLAAISERTNAFLVEPRSPSELAQDVKYRFQYGGSTSVLETSKFVSDELSTYFNCAQREPNDAQRTSDSAVKGAYMFLLVAFDSRTRDVYGAVSASVYRENIGMRGITRCVPYLLARSLDYRTTVTKSLNEMLLPAVDRLGKLFGCKNIVVNPMDAQRGLLLDRYGFDRCQPRGSTPMPYPNLCGSPYTFARCAPEGYMLYKPL